jgi:hypothetical protein
MRGMSSLRGALKDYDRQTQRSTGRFFSLKDGESAEVLFLGDMLSEPFVIYEHSFAKGGNQFSSIQHRLTDCVACYVATTGDRRLGRVQPKGCFSIYDMRWQKRKLDREKSTKDKEVYLYSDADESDVTDEGIAKKMFFRRGRCYWKASGQWATALDVIDTKAGARCKSCLKGKIKCVGYAKPDGTKVIPQKTEDELRELVAKGKYTERLSCTNCDEPARRSIFNSVVRITRTGKEKKTSYQFEVLADDIPEDVLELLDSKDGPKPFDFEKLFGEPSSDDQAAELGIRNPLRNSGDRSAKPSDDEADDYFDDDDDEYGADPFADDDEVEEKPARKKKVVMKKKGLALGRSLKLRTSKKSRW